MREIVQRINRILSTGNKRLRTFWLKEEREYFATWETGSLANWPGLEGLS